MDCSGACSSLRVQGARVPLRSERSRRTWAPASCSRSCRWWRCALHAGRRLAVAARQPPPWLPGRVSLAPSCRLTAGQCGTAHRPGCLLCANPTAISVQMMTAGFLLDVPLIWLMPPFFAAKRWQLPSDLSSDAADAMAVDSLDGWDADELTMNGSRCAAALGHAQHDTCVRVFILPREWCCLTVPVVEWV